MTNTTTRKKYNTPAKLHGPGDEFLALVKTPLCVTKGRDFFIPRDGHPTAKAAENHARDFFIEISDIEILTRREVNKLLKNRGTRLDALIR